MIVDTIKLAVNMPGDTLTGVAPKIERNLALLEAVIEISIKEPKAAYAVENLGDEMTVTNDATDVKGEKKWPGRDFPY